MQEEIKKWIKSSLSKDQNISQKDMTKGNIFVSLDTLFQTHFEKPAHSISEIKARNTKMKGDIFETFCKMYLENIGYEVYFQDELPEELMKDFSLTKKDYGIDLVAKKGDGWYAVQCKYRKKTKDYITQKEVHRIGWKDISTFLSLATRTGPKAGWKKNIIMTNADYVCWKGKKGRKDYTIAKKTFEGVTRGEWCKMAGLEGHSLIEEKKEEIKEDKKKDIIGVHPSNRDMINSMNIRTAASHGDNIRDLRKEWLDKNFVVNKKI